MNRIQSPHFSSSDFTFYATVDYFARLRQEIAKTVAGDRVQLTTMDFEPSEGSILAVIAKLRKAAKRGVHVSLSIDAHNFLVNRGRGLVGPLWLHSTLPADLPAYARSLHEGLQAIKDAGGIVGISNQPARRFTSPFSGRSHIKTTIINDQVYVGGCNLRGTRNLDLMVSWHDPATAEWLYNLMQGMITEQSTRALGPSDNIRAVDTHTELLVDSGVKHQSVIFDRAFEIIDNAEHWLIITCQFFPNSITAQHLKRAQGRGVHVYPIFNHPSQHIKPHNLLQYAVTDRERLRMPRSFFEGELPRNLSFLHAKLIATEKEAIVGSHNYVKAGVSFGTAEIALHRRDPQFSQNAVQTLLEELGFAHDARFDFVHPSPGSKPSSL